ncbi:MAG: transposase [Phycisphaerales bacterium]
MSSPLAYFLTWSCRGSWLHGDDRGSVDRDHNRPGAPLVMPDPGRRNEFRQTLTNDPVTLSPRQRSVVAQAVHDVCDRRGWKPLAVNARSTHVHVVLQAPHTTPERAMQQLKAWATRALREDDDTLPPGLWTRHGSTRYLWTVEHVAEAVHYVLHEQDSPANAARKRTLKSRFTDKSEPRA